jgi:hypothetical protein
MIQMKPLLIACDPGLSWGLAVFKDNELVDSVFHNEKAQGSWETAADRSMRYFRGVVKRFVGSTTRGDGWSVIEMPTFMESYGGHTTARSGALVKLALVCGMQYQTLTDMVGVSKFVPVGTWKGQLPKDVVAQRLVKLLDRDKCKVQMSILEQPSHDWDAVGIGMHALGRF